MVKSQLLSFRQPGCLPVEARGFAPPSRGGFAFVVDIDFTPRNMYDTQHVAQEATRAVRLRLRVNIEPSPSLFAGWLYHR